MMESIPEPLCRLCSSDINSLAYPIFESIAPGSNIKLVDQIWECLQIKVLKEDTLPHSICISCFNLTQQLFAFRETCHNTQIKLRECKPDKDNLNILNTATDDDSNKTKGEPSDSTIEETEDRSEVISTDNDDSESHENGNETPPEVGDPSPEDYVLMKEETFNIDANKVNNANRGRTGVLGDHLVEFNNNSDVRDRDVVEIQRVRQELLPPMWDVFEKSVPNDAGELQVTHRRYIVSKGAFPCSLCGACFRFDQGCDRGEAPDNGPYDCIICHKVFPKRSAWKKHQASHEDMKPFPCRECGKSFIRQEHLSRHLLSHTTIRPYSCESCGKSYARKEHLTRHQQSSPPCLDPNSDPVRPFSCLTCGQGFVRKEHLVKHSKRAHDIELNDDEPKPFSCPICSKTFTRREHLRRHRIVHAKEEGKLDDETSPPPSPNPTDKKPEPVRCEICKKTFSRRSHVLRHMKRIHNTTISGEIHQCEICNKKFGRKYHLERHMLCHVKPEYECVTCGDKFDQTELLDKHMTTVHGNAAVDSYLWM